MPLTLPFHLPQFYGSQKGDTVFFGDKGAKHFGTYWVDGGKGVLLDSSLAPHGST